MSLLDQSRSASALLGSATAWPCSQLSVLGGLPSAQVLATGSLCASRPGAPPPTGRRGWSTRPPRVLPHPFAFFTGGLTSLATHGRLPPTRRFSDLPCSRPPAQFPRLPSRPLRVRSSGLACGLILVNVLTVVPINIIVLNELKHVDWIVIGK